MNSINGIRIGDRVPTEVNIFSNILEISYLCSEICRIDLTVRIPLADVCCCYEWPGCMFSDLKGFDLDSTNFRIRWLVLIELIKMSWNKNRCKQPSSIVNISKNKTKHQQVGNKRHLYFYLRLQEFASRENMEYFHRIFGSYLLSNCINKNQLYKIQLQVSYFHNVLFIILLCFVTF